ncbi:hypothetical protein K458DRAFT_285803 [Lentithecium fluviatile CBS 122367]|uniref:Zn(2)-C6 fungal-type domain-containing protein n=1 Tax=Lentithecium fluviatile CBS 122367 TaxID=1168545 RepID=A0A6G1JNT3_9PLEO|nr:hypothetical protein K458DRAFT_285803 [Lentithecium fluviatile CBS 122367]
MSNTVRSKHGCWTCRLRKKKCDETRPACTTCVGLSITCHGYGPKPDWMDNGDAEKRTADSIKQIVKFTSRRKTGVRVPVRISALKLAPMSSASAPATKSTHDSEASRITTPPSDYKFLQNSRSAAEESILLMHFLDKVFPLQYPMYQPDIFEGGRGWLLALLLRTKPLYYAALALSSYHRRMLICQRISQRCRAVARVQEGKHLEACLIEAQKAMRSVDRFIQSRHNEVGVVLSIVQLVFFELFAGQNGVWKTHLNAAIDLYHKSCEDKLAHLGLSQVSRAKLCDDQPLKDEGAVVTQEVTTFRFLGGTIIWLDIISSVTSGTAPRLLSYHPGVLASDSQTKLDNIMGCRNCMMRQIGRIAALYAHRREATWAVTEFHQTAMGITKEIENELTGLEDPGASGKESELTGSQTDSITLVMKMFAWMATAYLHLITHGFQRLEELDAPISRTISLLRYHPGHLIPAVVAPLFMVGCCAREGDEQEYFRAIYASPQFQDPLYKHRARISSILEQVWTRRQTIGLSWDEVLEMGQVQTLLLL